MIKIQQLSKSYGNNKVLENINITFKRGEIHGIVGNNGAGKSTLFRCIAGIEKYTGTITSEYEILKNHLGFLHTEPYFFSKITGKEYIQLLCNGRQISESKIDEKNIFDLPLNQYASTYSTGMKKKLAIIGILLQNNDYFILDEPFNGLDVQSNFVITAIIRKLKLLNKVVIISSHIFSTLRENCDKIHFLDGSTIKKSTDKDFFDEIENEMKVFLLEDKIERLNLK